MYAIPEMEAPTMTIPMWFALGFATWTLYFSIALIVTGKVKIVSRKPSKVKDEY